LVAPSTANEVPIPSRVILESSVVVLGPRLRGTEQDALLIADRAYDPDSLDAELAEKGIELIAPYRRNRKKAKIQDGRKLRRYKRRWKVERLFAWLGNFRRLVVRYERRRKQPWLCETGMPRNPT
jgi:transposase